LESNQALCNIALQYNLHRYAIYKPFQPHYYCLPHFIPHPSAADNKMPEKLPPDIVESITGGCFIEKDYFYALSFLRYINMPLARCPLTFNCEAIYLAILSKEEETATNNQGGEWERCGKIKLPHHHRHHHRHHHHHARSREWELREKGGGGEGGEEKGERAMKNFRIIEEEAKEGKKEKEENGSNLYHYKKGKDVKAKGNGGKAAASPNQYEERELGYKFRMPVLLDIALQRGEAILKVKINREEGNDRAEDESSEEEQDDDDKDSDYEEEMPPENNGSSCSLSSLPTAEDLWFLGDTILRLALLAYFHRVYPSLQEDEINEKLKDSLHISRLMDWFFTSSFTSHFFTEQQQQPLCHRYRYHHRQTKLLLELCSIWKRGKQWANEKSVSNSSYSICQYYYMKYIEEKLSGAQDFDKATSKIKGCFKGIIAAVFLDSNRDFITACRVYANLAKSSRVSVNFDRNNN